MVAESEQLFLEAFAAICNPKKSVNLLLEFGGTPRETSDSQIGYRTLKPIYTTLAAYPYLSY